MLHELLHCDADLFLKCNVGQSRTDSETERKCQISFFQQVNQNKEVANREWLCFSPAIGKIYCYVSKIVTESLSDSSLEKDGFCNWKKAHEKLNQHETSKRHLNAIIVLHH